MHVNKNAACQTDHNGAEQRPLGEAEEDVDVSIALGHCVAEQSFGFVVRHRIRNQLAWIEWRAALGAALVTVSSSRCADGPAYAVQWLQVRKNN